MSNTLLLHALGFSTLAVDHDVIFKSDKNQQFGFQQVPTQTGLYRHRRWLEAGNFGFRKKKNCTIRVSKTKMLISFAVLRSLSAKALISFAVLRSLSAPLFSPMQIVGFPMRWLKSLLLHFRLTQDRGDGVVSHNAPLPLSNTTRSYSSLVEANQRGPRQDPGIPHTGHGAPAPSVAKVAPNAHSQPPTQGSRQPLPSDQDQASPTLSEGQASSQGSDDQATPQGSYQAQGPPSMPAFPPWGSGAPGYSMGSPRPGYPGQMPPDAKGMPPYMPPYYYDFMRNPGNTIRILHECQVLIDKSVPRVTFWHHEARRVMPNCDPRDRFVYPYLT